MSPGIVKVLMDSEKFVKGLMAIAYNRGVDPNTMFHILNYTAAAVNLDPELVAAWVTEEALRLNEENQDEEESPEPVNETPEELSDKEA